MMKISSPRDWGANIFFIFLSGRAPSPRPLRKKKISVKMGETPQFSENMFTLDHIQG